MKSYPMSDFNSLNLYMEVNLETKIVLFFFNQIKSIQLGDYMSINDNY